MDRHIPDYKNLTSSSYGGFQEHLYKIVHENVTSATTSVVVENDILDYFNTVLATSPLGRKLQNLALLDCQIGIRIVVQGQPFAAGKIVYSFVPAPRAKIAAGSQYHEQVPLLINDVNAMIVPHIDVDPGASKTYDLILPNVSPTGVYGMVSSTGMGSYALVRHVISPLISGTATAPTMNVCVYMYLKNPSLEGPTLTTLSSQATKEQGSGILSYAVRSAGKLASAVTPVFPVFGPALTLFSAAASPVADLLSWFGFRKAQALNNDFLVLNRQVDNWSQIDGVSTAYVLADTGFVKLSIDPSVGCGVGDEMAIAWVVSQPGLIIMDSVTNAMASETLVRSFDVHPTTAFDDATGGTLLYPSPLAGIAYMFTYWCGDITFDVEVIASIFHRCTLLVAYDCSYNSAVSPTFQNALQTLPNVTINVTGRSRTSVTIPYRLNAVWTKTKAMGPAAATVGFSGNNGKLYYFVVNPLTSNGSTDPIRINTYMYSKNMDFQYPTTSMINSHEVSVQVLAEDSAEVSFGSTVVHDRSLLSFGVRFNSVKELASKMSRYITLLQPVTTTAGITFWGMKFSNKPGAPTSATVNPSADGSRMHMSLLGWVSQAYLTYRGGLRYAFHIEHGEVISVQGSHKLAYVALDDGPTFLSAQCATNLPPSYSNSHTMISDDNPAFDIVVPQIHPWKFSCPRMVSATFPGTVTFLSGILKVSATTTLHGNINAGAADDATFGFFLGFPCIQVAV